MNEHRSEKQDYVKRLDSDLNLRAIVLFTAGLALLCIVTALLMWGLSLKLREGLKAQDPPEPVLLEAQMPYLPPEPRLQSSPPKEMAELRAEEDRLLSEYAWTDREAGVGRIPIDRAMSLVLEQGLPVRGEGSSAESDSSIAPGPDGSAKGSEG
jgi:hypothetical protein